MKIKFTSHIKQHAGDILLECQDSFNYNLENLSFAVSDGVSQAYRPELWSRILTEGFINNPETFFIKDSNNNLVVNPDLGLSAAWVEDEKFAYQNATAEEQFILDLKKNAINVAAATFIGIRLLEEGIKYQTIGDSVLFFFDYNTKKLEAYSSMMPENGDMVFNNSPEYIDSNGVNHGKVISGVLPYRNGILFMATDALSDWIVERRESVGFEDLLKELMAIPTHLEFDGWVDCARNDSNPTKLKDDDTTFIAIEFLNTEDNTVGARPLIEHKFTTKFDALIKDNLLFELNSLKNELEEAKNAKLKSERDIRSKEKQINTLTTELESSRSDRENLLADVDRLNKELQSVNAKINQLNVNLNRLTKENSGLEKVLQTLRNEIAQLNRENKRLEGIINSLKTPPLPPPSTKKDEEIADLKRELNKIKAIEQNLRQELGTLRKHAEQTRTLFTTNGELTNIDISMLLDNLLGECSAIENIYVEQTIQVGKPNGDGGFRM